MVVLVERFNKALKFPIRPESKNRDSGSLWASLREFRHDVSQSLNEIALNPEPGAGKTLSLARIHKCFHVLALMNKAFAKLMAEIDYPMNKWGSASTEEYLNYSLNLLDLLNSVKSSVNHLIHARISLSHAVNLMENTRCPTTKLAIKIPPKELGKRLKLGGVRGSSEKCCSEKESVMIEALVAMKSTAFWLFSLVFSGVCSDDKTYTEMRELIARFDDSLVKGLDSRICQEIRGKHGIWEEIKELNDAASGLDSADIVKDLKRRLEEMEKSLLAIEKETTSLFLDVLGTRNKLLDGFRHGP